MVTNILGEEYEIGIAVFFEENAWVRTLVGEVCFRKDSKVYPGALIIGRTINKYYVEDLRVEGTMIDDDHGQPQLHVSLLYRTRRVDRFTAESISSTLERLYDGPFSDSSGREWPAKLALFLAAISADFVAVLEEDGDYGDGAEAWRSLDLREGIRTFMKMCEETGRKVEND